MAIDFSDFIENEYSQIRIKDIAKLKKKAQDTFSAYFVNKRTFNLYIDLLCMEFVKYNKIVADKKIFSFFESKIFDYQNLYIFQKESFLELMKTMYEIDEESSNNYMSICINQHSIKGLSKYDDLDNMMKMIGDLLEECLYRNLRLLYGFVYFNANNIISPKLFSLNFGELVCELKNHLTDPTILNDFIYNISLNQIRNICKHKTYKLINDKEIRVEYGTTNKKTAIIKYDDILKILKNINLFNSAIKLLFNLIYLDIMPEIQHDLIYDNIRLEESFSSLFYNLRYLNFRIIKYGLNKQNNIFELFFEDIDCSGNTQNRIILISQNFPRIAAYIDDDKILNISPDKIKIYLFYNNIEIANTAVQYNLALDYTHKKINTVELINNTEFNIKINKI